jgi:putative tricarboxylic transport membrane protein
VFDLGLVLAFGVLGYLMRLFTIPILPIVLGIVLGFMVESNYRRSMLISGGEHGIFIEDKVSLLLLCLAVGLTAYTLIKEFNVSKESKA